MNTAISKDPGARKPGSSASVREKKQPYESRETSSMNGYDSEDDSEKHLEDDSEDDSEGDPDYDDVFIIHKPIRNDCSAVSHDSGYSEPHSYDGGYPSRRSKESGFLEVGSMEPSLVSGDSSYSETPIHEPTSHGSDCNYVSGDSGRLVPPENIQTRSPIRREKSNSELGGLGHVPDDKSQGYNFDGTQSTLVFNQNKWWTYNGSSIPGYNLHSDSLASNQYYHANFPAEQNQFSHPSPLIHVNLPKDGSLRTNRSSESTQTSIATDASFDFESLNAASDIETDWEEDEGGRDCFYRDIRQSGRGKRITNAEIRQFRENRLAKDPQKQKIIDILMAEFYMIFKKAKTGFKSCAEGQGSSSQGSIKGTASKSDLSLTSTAGTKHRISNGEDNQGGEGEEDEERPPKRPRLPPTSTEDRISGFKFACPYHQHNPRKYGLDCSLHDKNYRSCAGPGWKSVARIKEHLYRRHRNPIKCSRCCKVFKAQEDLKAHLRILVPCGILPDEPVEGVTDEVEKKLKCRKKISPDQTEEDRWRAIYQILFPNELIPSPYYEYDNKLAITLAEKLP